MGRRLGDLAGLDGALCLTDAAEVVPNHYPGLERQVRKVEKAAANRRGIRPAKKLWLLCVETTALAIPTWAIQRREKRLSLASHRVWFRGRNNGRAQILARQDRQAGGDPVVTAVEYRVCKNCGRLMLNLEAAMRRRLEESHHQGRELPCGEECR